MKTIISTFMIFIASVLFAQNSKLETIYNQIPPIQGKILCESADNYIEIQALLDLNDFEYLSEFITNYKSLYDIISGGIDNQDRINIDAMYFLNLH